MQSKYKKWGDLLITIIPGFNNTKVLTKSYGKAADFLSAFAYDNDAYINFGYNYGMGVKKDFKLESAKFLVYNYRNIPLGRDIVGNELFRIPKIENDQQRMAVKLFREAKFSNNKYLSFLFYWHILETEGTSKAISYVDKKFKVKDRIPGYIISELEKINLNGKSYGNYFYDDCRNAITHINNRKQGKIRLLLDTIEDNIKFSVSARIVEYLTKDYIKDILNLTKFLWLVKNKYKFPTFIECN